MNRPSLAFIVLICAGIALNAQNDMSRYFIDDDIQGFLGSCDQDKRLAISLLRKFTLSDTITSDKIWYNQTVAKNINPYERSIEGFDRYYTSMKLKSYFWILQIVNSKYYNDSNLCVFIGNKNNYIFDYEIINQDNCELLFTEILTGYSLNKSIIFQYKRISSDSLVELEQDFQNWFDLLDEKGFDYMYEYNIQPINDAQYKIIPIGGNRSF